MSDELPSNPRRRRGGRRSCNQHAVWTLVPLEIRRLRRSAVALTPSLKSSVAQLGLLGEFVVGGGQHAVGEAGAHGGAGGDQAERRAFGDLGGELHRLSPHLVLRHADIGEAHAGGFLAGDAAAGVEDQFRIVLADQFGERRGQAEAGMEAELGEVGGEARFGAGDAEVGGYRKAEPAADGGAMDGGDDRLLVAEDAHGLDVEVVDRAQVAGRILSALASPAPAASDRRNWRRRRTPCLARRAPMARISMSLSNSSSASAIWLISETSKKFSGGFGFRSGRHGRASRRRYQCTCS